MSGFVYANLSLNWLKRRLQKNLTSERASIYYTKKDVLKNRFFSNFFMLVVFSSPVKFFKSCKVVLQKQFLSVVANPSKSDFSTVN